MAWIYLSVFGAGVCSLAIELSASRLLGPYFGAGNIVWISIIGVILICLALGSYLGGKRADKSPTRIRFYQLGLWSAFLSILVPLAATLLLPALAALQLPLMIGVVSSSIFLFALPVTLLGGISPFAVRLLVQEGLTSSGRYVGQIYAVSTLGSVLGAILPVVVLLPRWGAKTTFLFFGTALLLLSGAGLLKTNRDLTRRYIWMLVGTGIVWWVVLH